MGLYSALELGTVDDFWKAKYGTVECPPEAQNIWRLALTKHVSNSFTFFASNFVFVSDKRSRLVLLRPFVGQAIHRYALDCQLRAGLPGRIVEAKARQVGWTIENLARGLHYCLDERHDALFLVDDEDVASKQAIRFNTMLNGLPGFLQPMRRIDNLKHLVFDNPNPKSRASAPGLNSEARMTVPSAFRGVPPGYVCVQEYAHMLPDRQLMVQSGLISAMPLTPESILIVDTTPNGEDESYAPMIRRAVEANPKWTRRIEEWKGELRAQDVLDGILGVPDSVQQRNPRKMVPTVCPWRLHEEYSARSKTTPHGEMRPMTKAQKTETLATLGKLSEYGGEEELDLRDRYGVCLERLWWRRAKIDQYELPTEEMRLLTFRQEFMSTIESAIIESGATPFDRASMDALARMERRPSAIGLFRSEDEFEHWEWMGESIGNHRDPNPWHEIRLYAPPQNGEKYTMGVDTNIAYESADSDATVAQVVRFRDNKIVATYEARVPSHLLIDQLYYLYRWYFNCYYAIEMAGMGYDLVRRCIERGMSNVHYYKRYDADHPEPTKYPGWETNKITRPFMDQTLLEMLCHRNPGTGKVEPLCTIPDAQTIKEIRGLSRSPSGAFKSSRGHDDHVDALEVAWCIGQDPYSGLRRINPEEAAKLKPEFESNFAMLLGKTKQDRNHPSLEYL